MRIAKECLLCGIPHKRHAFAVRTLLEWYRDDVDVQARLPLLSTYMGHVNPASTFYYLTAAPELLQLVANRLDSTMDPPSSTILAAAAATSWTRNDRWVSPS